MAGVAGLKARLRFKEPDPLALFFETSLFAGAGDAGMFGCEVNAFRSHPELLDSTDIEKPTAAKRAMPAINSGETDFLCFFDWELLARKLLRIEAMRLSRRDMEGDSFVCR